LEESFRKFTLEEELTGDNQYAAEGHGKQDAVKGLRFLDFPPVLHLHLKRFQFDFVRNTMRKVSVSISMHECDAA
jgi:ubiquitin carboxyl-terminal hydrolase 7